MIKLTIGMATYDDFDGVYFSVQALRMFHNENNQLHDCELVIVDNHPTSSSAGTLMEFVNWIRGDFRQVRYIPLVSPVGTAPPRQKVFEEAQGEAVLCMDSHVMLHPKALSRLLVWYQQNKALDLFSGPMLYDDLKNYSSHMADEWRGEMWGTWQTDLRAMSEDASSFEIPAMGLGAFTCMKEAWLGFNPNFRGFGGEEWYIHEKFRRAGRNCVCLPFLRWLHRFGRPLGVKYPLTRYDKVRNYVIGHHELGMSLHPIHQHFVAGNLLPVKDWETIIAHPEDPPHVGNPQGRPPRACGSCGKAVTAPTTTEQVMQPSKSTLEQFCDAAGIANYHEEIRKLLVDGKKLLLGPQPGMTSDYLFITAPKSAEELWPVLKASADKVTHRMFIVGTFQYGEMYRKDNNSPPVPGLMHALREFMKEHPEWSVQYYWKEGPGMTVLTCHQEDRPKLPSKLKQISNFAKHMVMHAADGFGKVSLEVLESRLDTCSVCEYRNDTKCSVCGCPIETKAELRSQYCPLGKWNNLT